MKRRSNTKQPHDPHELYLDEDISGPKLASLLKQGQLIVHQYETRLRRHKKTPDEDVIRVCSESNYVPVTTDKCMESDWIDDMVKHKARGHLFGRFAGRSYTLGLCADMRAGRLGASLA